MANKKQGYKEWATVQLSKAVPYEVWVKQKERSEFEKEMYKEVYNLLLDIRDEKVIIKDIFTSVAKRTTKNE